MAKLNLVEVQKRLEVLGQEFVESTSDICNKKHDLIQIILEDSELDIDEVTPNKSSYTSLTLDIIRRSGRRDINTCSRNGSITSKLTFTFNWRKFADGGWETKVNIEF